MRISSFIRQTITFLFILCLTAANIIAGPRDEPRKSATEDQTQKVDAFLAQWDKPDMPGCAVGAVQDGKFVYKRAFGMANLDHDVPNTTSTLFNLASVSKPFTATSIALLARQGKLSLDDDIRKFVPEMPQYKDTVKVRHLIHHTSGIREYQALVLFGGLGIDNAYDSKSILKILARQKNLSFTPGSKYQYTNSGYLLLAIIVERVSGKSLRAFAEENIFKPLGMKNTQYFDNRFEVVKKRAHGYQISPDKKILARSSLFDLVGGGGVLTSIEDLYLWTQNYYDPKVGDKELIQLMTTPATLNDGEKIKYGFGVWRQEFKGLPMIEHSGNMMGYRAKIFAFPEQRFTAIALCNNMAILPGTIASKLADIYLEGQIKPAPAASKSVAPPLPPAAAIAEADLARYAGIYAHRENGKVIKLAMKDGKLIESAIYKKDLPVLAAPENRLFVADGNGMTELRPVIGPSGSVTEIRIDPGSGAPDVFFPVRPPLDSPEQLSQYAGDYYSDELDADYKIELKGNTLNVHISDNLQPSLTPDYADSFYTANGEIKFLFTRDQNGKITGFVFNSGLDSRDVKGVAFKRK